MFTPKLQHPSNAPGLIASYRARDFSHEANRELRDEMLEVIDSFRAADNGPQDLNPKPGVVHLRSPKGRSETHFATSVNRQESKYRDREGYWETHVQETLSSASYRRVDLGANGQPLRQVEMSFVDSPGGDLITKTVTDRAGTSVSLGGAGRLYQSTYYPGDSFNSRA